MSPRPILKRSTAYETPNQHTTPHAVHFPPSPSLTTHFSVYSASAYDRSPIVVAPNSCALPERGCPGRTYTLDDPRGHSYSGRILHPRVFARQQQREDQDLEHSYPHPPPLIPDLSSESDESDGFVSPPLESSYVHGLAIPSARHDKHNYFPLDIDMYGSTGPLPSALSFLPHPPSPPSSPVYPYNQGDDHIQKPRRRRERERKHESSSVPDRIPSGSGEVKEGATSRNSRRSSRVSSSRKSLPSFAGTAEDQGCLGGF